jgi:nondiscriminating glutamyl-tRNA synthetase
MLLYEALDKTPPIFAHVPLIFDTDRAKLSKRKHGEFVHISKYMRDGYLPEALMNYLAQMSWTPADGRETFSVEEGCKMFDLDRVSKSPAIFDIKRLEWFNSHYIKTLPLAEITERVKPFLAEYDLLQYSPEKLEEIVGILRDGLTALKDVTAAGAFFFVDTVQIPDDLKSGLLKQESSRKVLAKVLEDISKFTWGDAKGCKAVVDAIGKELGLKGKDLYWPLRAALCGATSGPDLGLTLSILGEKRVKSRIEVLLQPC